jgi:toxin ParE1/3/4
MKRVVIGNEASVEIKEAIAFLNRRREGVGYDFDADVEAALEMIGKQPKAFSPYKRGFRKYVVQPFGYLIFYKELDDYVWIAAVAHGKRKPDYWINRKPT